MKTVYVASLLGFTPESMAYRSKIKRKLREVGRTVLDPWDQSYRAYTEEASRIEDWTTRIAAFKRIADGIGRSNEDMIRSCDFVLGVLDGAELDSGTVSEIGFAAGLGKKCYGLRTDFTDYGEFDGLPFNLQVLYWIESGGGRLFKAIREIEI